MLQLNHEVNNQRITKEYENYYSELQDGLNKGDIEIFIHKKDLQVAAKAYELLADIIKKEGSKIYLGNFINHGTFFVATWVG